MEQDPEGGTSLKDLGNALRPAVVRLMRAENKMLDMERSISDQWPFQEPKLEVPTIYKAYVRAKFQGISPQNMALHGTVPPI